MDGMLGRKGDTGGNRSGQGAVTGLPHVGWECGAFEGFGGVALDDDGPMEGPDGDVVGVGTVGG